MFYTFVQNNVGGRFVGPRYLIVEAKSASAANRYRAAHYRSDYCECCGSRWYPVDDRDGTLVPEVWGKPAEEFDLPIVIVRFADRRKKEV